MTYCVGIKLNAGLVFLSDSRTNAGVDNISTYRKMIVYERPGDRFMVLLSAGNLSISQSVREILQVEQLKERAEDAESTTIWNAKSMFDAARVLGNAVRHVYDRDAEASTRAASNMLLAFQMVMGAPWLPSSRVSRSSSIWRISRTDCEMLRLPDDSSTMTRSPGCS